MEASVTVGPGGATIMETDKPDIGVAEDGIIEILSNGKVEIRQGEIEQSEFSSDSGCSATGLGFGALILAAFALKKRRAQ